MQMVNRGCEERRGEVSKANSKYRTLARGSITSRENCDLQQVAASSEDREVEMQQR